MEQPPDYTKRRQIRPRFLLLALAAAAVLAAGLVAFVPLAFEKEEAPALPPVSRAARPGEARAALARAAAALRAGDRAGFVAALPASGSAARRAVRSLYRHLQPIPWGAFRFTNDPIPGVPGRFDVFAVGAIGGVGPGDRKVADRVLDFRVLGDRVVVTGDATPAAVARQYLMAYNRPIVVRRPGCVVIADRSWRPLAVELADASGPARRQVAAAGIKVGRPVVVYLYGSAGQLRTFFAGGISERRIRFFSHSPDRLSDKVWQARDVGAVGPDLAGQEAWTPLMLAHELTHAYTMGWFAGRAHTPSLLVEGIAVMVEGGRSYAPLRDEMAAGFPRLPLLTALAEGSLWSGSSRDEVHLGYLEGGALAGYVRSRWGVAGLKRFSQAVADSDLSEGGVDRAARRSLHTSWRALYAGWTGYVQTLP